MQSESSEYSPYSPNLSSDLSNNTAQYGFHCPAPGIRHALEDDPVNRQPRGAVEPDDAPCGEIDETVRLSRAGNGDTCNNITPVKAIIDYENALLPASPKIEDDGPALRVIPSKSRREGPQLDQFPNGRHTMMEGIWSPANAKQRS